MQDGRWERGGVCQDEGLVYLALGDEFEFLAVLLGEGGGEDGAGGGLGGADDGGDVGRGTLEGEVVGDEVGEEEAVEAVGGAGVEGDVAEACG